MRNIDQLYSEIDQDEGLKSKRRLLTFTSLILLAIQFTGAKIEEANTFIVKLSFEHQNGMALLLMFSIVFALIRYYNYAKRYHNDLYLIWSNNLLKDNKVEYFCPHSDDVSGLLHESYPKGFNIEMFLYKYPDENLSYKTHYECEFFLVRYFRFTWNDQHEDYSGKVNILKNIGFKAYLSVLGMEAKYQFSRYFTHRENLDILFPYFLGVFSLFSYIFADSFDVFINCLLNA
ncbi:hypothetical protein [Alcanivorax sp. DP30]|uniref:hypothetical protein n=1 Tax=Alcanivorax sp. DP30 TaxID=2606217 RepID=UPI00136C5D9B|nr:hypothetical protein [Alcanivorax sp. DP30]MZR64073.1 hypothetical protein [Alcanivorax sp. DP30]